ncbi:hypothetical protein M0802_001316 [Mischocyttarus mexicanus]|nr:hypothetical protein M0802_001316 [Mischocyttarus mexicanus]
MSHRLESSLNCLLISRLQLRGDTKEGERTPGPPIFQRLPVCHSNLKEEERVGSGGGGGGRRRCTSMRKRRFRRERKSPDRVGGEEAITRRILS